MALPFHNGVRLDGFDFPDFQITFLLNPSIVAADIGKVLSMDGTTPNQLKLAAAGDMIVGQLCSVEVRAIDGITTGMVSLMICDVVPITTGLSGGFIVAVGSRVEGGGAGGVRTAASPTAANPLVVELRTVTTVALNGSTTSVPSAVVIKA